jgi:lipopolysaccharide export system permease protein
MSTIQRYVVWEVIKFFLIVLTGTTMLMVLGAGVKEAIRKGLPLALMVEILPYMLPEMLRFTIPGCLLFAVCLVFGRMSGSNEVVALKSAGVSPTSVMWPVFVLSIALTVGTYQFYDLCATWGRPNLARTLIESVEEIAYGILRAERSFRTSKFSINVKDVVGRKLIKPIIVLNQGGNRPTVTLNAAEAEIESDPEKRVLIFRCRNGKIDVAGKTKFWFSGVEKQVVPFDEPPNSNPAALTPANLGMHEIPGQIRHEQQVLAAIHAQQAQISMRNLPENAALAASFRHHQLRLWRLCTEPHRRWSNGFNCLSFAIIGIAVALSLRLSDNLTIFFVCFLPILVAFYPLLVVGEYLATKGILPPSAVWLPNVVLVGAALVLMRRVIRY